MKNTSWRLVNQLCAYLLTVVCSSAIAVGSKEPDQSLFDLAHLNFTAIGQDDIPREIITSIAQSQDGFIWLGTQSGLLRFDGYDFIAFKHNKNDNNSLSGDYVYSLWTSIDNQVWAGTFGDGVSVYHPDSDKFVRYKHQSDVKQSLSDNVVRAIIGDNRGNVFAATNNGLTHINADTGEVTRLTNIVGCDNALADQRIRSVLLDRNHNLWVGSTSGLCRITAPKNKPADQSSLWSQPLIGQEWSAFNQQNVFRLFEAQDGKIWLGTKNHGAAYLDLTTEEIVRLPSSSDNQAESTHSWINTIIQPNSREVWLGSSGGGISIVKSDNGQILKRLRHDPVIPQSINLDEIGALFTDKSGLVWVGTWGAGLNLYNPSDAAFRTLKHSPYDPLSLSHSDVGAILELDNRDVWIANSRTGIDIVSPSKGVVGHIHPWQDANANNGYVSTLLQSSDGTKWVGTSDSGLYGFNEQNLPVYRYSINEGLPDNQILKLIETPGQQLWVATASGIGLVDLQQNQVRSIAHFSDIAAIQNKAIWSMAMTAGSLLWLGTYDGLFAINLKSQQVIAISEKSGITNTLSDNAVFGLLLDRNGRLLVNTLQGLDRLVSYDGSLAIFESIDQLVGREPVQNSDVMEDTLGRLWSQSSWLDPHNGQWQPLDFSELSGFGPAWTGSFTQLHDGTMLYGGTEGLMFIRPELWQPWEYHPPLVVSQLNVDNIAISGTTNQITLPTDTQGFSLEFAALDYTAPSRLQYQYKLEGFDKDWINTDSRNRRATYTNLPPGDFVLKIKGANRKGIWSEHQLALNISQLPAWYETTWFRFSMTLIAFIVFYTLYQWRIRQLKQQKSVLDELVKSRTANISMLGTIGQEITSTLQLDNVLELVYQHVNELLDASTFAIGIVDVPNNKISFRFAIENGQRLPLYEEEMSAKERPAVKCVLQAKEIIVMEASELSEILGQLPEPQQGDATESLMYLPLSVNDQVIGCLSAQSLHKNAYDDNDVQMLRTIASYTSVALANANSVQRLTDTHNELERTFEQLKETHDNLKKTQKELIESEKIASLGRIVAGVSHEVNTPLGIAITSGSSLRHKIETLQTAMENKQLKQRQLKDFFNYSFDSIDYIESSLSKVKNLVNNFRQIDVLSHLESRQTFELTKILKLDKQLINTQRLDKQISITYDFACKIEVDSYPDAIHQALSHLYQNSVIHAFASGESGEVILRSSQPKDGNVIIEFQDNGCGIEPSLQARIFEPFISLSMGQTSGLGLNIVYNLVTKILRGKISVESEPGVGSKFIIEIPIEAPESKPQRLK